MRRTLIAAFALAVSCDSTAGAVEAIYEITFENLWNPTDHPRNYPGSAHFSPLVGASHSDRVSFWSDGVLASPGVELVAELGKGNTLIGAEISSAIAAGDALQSTTNRRNIFRGQSSSRQQVTVTDEFPLVTLLSMVAPSPDWFVGVHDVDLRAGNSFAESLVFEFDSFYDAGTENGDGFSLSNPPTVPQEPIQGVAGVDAARIFVDPLAAPDATIAPIARITLTRVSFTVPEPAGSVLAMLVVMAAPGVRRRRAGG